QDKRDDHFGAMTYDVIVHGVVQVAEVVKHDACKVGEPRQRLMHNVLAERKRHKDDQKDGDGQSDYFQHGRMQGIDGFPVYVDAPVRTLSTRIETFACFRLGLSSLATSVGPNATM